MVAALRQVQARLARLHEARETSSRILADLEARMARLLERTTGKEQIARELVATDEEAARRLLIERAELEMSHERLAKQVRALRDDLARLDDLQAQLEAKAAELKAIGIREDLATVVNEGGPHDGTDDDGGRGIGDSFRATADRGCTAADRFPGSQQQAGLASPATA
jgi:hypothetical protein